jgi:hypothetical protein
MSTRARAASGPRDLRRERRADEVLHDEVELALLGLADVVDVDDVRVVDAVGGARLAEHPRAEVRLAAQVGADELERDDAVDEHVARSVDDAHRADSARPTFAEARFVEHDNGYPRFRAVVAVGPPAEIPYPRGDGWPTALALT